MANFRIVEGDDLFESVKDEFVHLYDTGVKIQDIQKKLGLTKSQYHNFFYRLRRTGEISKVRNPNAGPKPEPRHHPKKNPRNYSYNKFTKRWTVTYRETYYGCFHRKEQAVRFVELMRECNWDISRKKELKSKVIKELKA